VLKIFVGQENIITFDEVAKRSGIGSANNLYLAYKRDFNLAPGY